MNIEISNKTSEKVDEKKISIVVEKFLKFYKKETFSISLAFIDDAEMQGLNKEYRNIDKVTDVLSFSDGEAGFLGELIICPSQIKKQAGEYENSEQEEMIFILVHGLLHLIGYTDESDETREEMIKLGEEFIVSIYD